MSNREDKAKAKFAFKATQPARQAARQQNVKNRIVQTGVTNPRVTKTERGTVVSATTPTGAKVNRSLRTGVAFGTTSGGKKQIGRPPRLWR